MESMYTVTTTMDRSARLEQAGAVVETVAIVVMVTAMSLVLRLLINWFICYCVLGYRLGARLDEQGQAFGQKIGQLPYQLSTAILFPLLGGLSFAHPSVASAPFTGWDMYVQRILEIFLGHLIGEFVVMSSQYPRCAFRFSLNLIHLVWAILCYIIILSTEANALLGVLGMIVYYCNFHVYLHSMLKNFDNNLSFINLVVWLLAIALLGLLTPVSLTVYLSMHVQQITEMPVFHFVLLIAGLVYIVSLCLVQISVIVRAMGSESPVGRVQTTSYPEIRTDSNSLLTKHMKSHYGVYQTLIATANRGRAYGSIQSPGKTGEKQPILPL